MTAAIWCNGDGPGSVWRAPEGPHPWAVPAGPSQGVGAPTTLRGRPQAGRWGAAGVCVGDPRAGLAADPAPG